MKQIVPVGIALWIPIVIFLFWKLPKHRAVIVAFVVGFMYLPGLLEKKINAEAPNSFPFPFLPFTKQNIICLSVLCGAVIFDQKRLFAFRPRWFDLPMVLWCLCPFLSAIFNDPPTREQDPFDVYGKFGPIYIGPLYDGFSQARIQTLNWGVPYLVGRLYFGDTRNMYELVVAMILGAIAYVPLCLFEWKMSPLLHTMVYGFPQHEPGQAQRGANWRPVVFMEHGLAVGMWIAVSMLAAFWLWLTGTLKDLHTRSGEIRVPLMLVFFVLIGTSVLIGSGGALMLGLAGLVAMLFMRRFSPRLVMAGVLMIAPLYMIGRVTSRSESTGWLARTYSRWDDEEELKKLEDRALGQRMLGWGWWSSRELIDVIGGDRGGSFRFRLVNEDRLMDKVKDRVWFGWGGWERDKIGVEENPDDPLKNLVVADALWIITLSNRGVVGLFLLYLAMLLPIARFAWIYPRQLWSHPAFAPAAVASVFVALWMVDNVSNNMFNPLFVVITGGIAGLTATGRPQVLPSATASAQQMAPQARPMPQPYPGRRLGVAPPPPPVPAPEPPRPGEAPPPQGSPHVAPRKPGLLRRRLPGQ